jgi:membrane protease YdiL (CAAX protease family)
MQSYLKTRPVWIQLMLFLGMAFGIFMVLSLIGVTLLSSITGISITDVSDPAKWNSGQPNMIVFIRGMLVVQFLGLFLIPSLLFAYFSDPQPMRHIGLQQKGRPLYWVLGIAAMLIAIPLVQYIGDLNRQINFGRGTQQWMQSMEDEAARQIKFMLGRNTPTELILNIIFIAAFAGIGEELFFRGVLQRIFIKVFKSPWAGIVITAILFSGFHFQFFGFFPRLLLGILLGAIYSGSLWPAIVAHFVYDAFFITLAYFYPQMLDETESTFLGGPTGLMLAALVSAVLVALIVWVLHKNSTADYNKVYSDDDIQEGQKFTFDE